MSFNKRKLDNMKRGCMTFSMMLAMATPVLAQTAKRVTMSFVRKGFFCPAQSGKADGQEDSVQLR